MDRLATDIESHLHLKAHCAHRRPDGNAAPVCAEINQTNILLLMTDEERDAPPYETDELKNYRKNQLP
jgi:hypothetical protein